MKIHSVQTIPIIVALEKPLTTAIHRTSKIGCALVVIEADQGIQGQGYIISLNIKRLGSFVSMIESLTPLLINKNPLYVEQIWNTMWQDINPAGLKGVSVSAMSAIDTALWDIVAKHAGLPVYHIWGACRDRVKAYASSGLWLGNTIDELIEEANQFINQGFRSIKLRVGSERIEDDIERARLLRESVGPDIEILTDANQSLTPRKAIALAQGLASLDIGWLEEPVPANDLVGHRRVMQAVDIPIASGETEYTRFGMKDMLDNDCIDILMPDLQRMGGFSEFRKATALAASYHIPVSTHIFTEYSLSIAGATHNCISVEHVNWFEHLFNEKIGIEQGEALIPDRAGHGFTFNDDYITQNKL